MTKQEFRFDDVVFFGRSIDEYVSMFDLDLSELKGTKILDCSAGPSAFAAQAAKHDITVVACDPRYDDDAATLSALVDDHAEEVQQKQTKSRHLFHPQLVSVAERKLAMKVFLQDFSNGKQSGRYVAGALPKLPFADRSFDSVLCANLLFIYSDASVGGLMHGSPFTYQFHLDSLRELLRVTRHDVRIYPLQGTDVIEHDWLRPLMRELEKSGYVAQIRSVEQRDIIGAEEMLRIVV